MQNGPALDEVYDRRSVPRKSLRDEAERCQSRIKQYETVNTLGSTEDGEDELTTSRKTGPKLRAAARSGRSGAWPLSSSKMIWGDINK